MRLHPDMLTNPRVAALISSTGPTAMFCIICLWIWAGKYAPNGDLSRLSPSDIQNLAGWSEWGDEQPWFDRLIEYGFIERRGGGIHLVTAGLVSLVED